MQEKKIDFFKSYDQVSLQFNFQVFWVQFMSKMMFISKDLQCSDRSFCTMEFFFVSRDLNSELGLEAKNLEENLANLIQMLTSSG